MLLMESPHQTWGKRLGAAVIWALMAAGFGVTGWLFALQPVTVALANWNVARDYKAVPATIVQRTGSDENGTFYWQAARYEVDGKSYETSRMTVLEDEAIDEPANAVVMKGLDSARSAQKPVTVWVSPRVPEIAVVSRDLPISTLWPRTLMGVGFAIFALAGVTGFFGALFGFGYYSRQFDAAGLWGFSAAWCGFIFPIMLLVSQADDVEFFVLVIVGLFALIGVLMLWGAVSSTLTGSSSVASMKLGSNQSKLDSAALATSYGRKGKPASGKIKRGGLGGRGDDFDKS